jgi:hypothetical protein
LATTTQPFGPQQAPVSVDGHGFGEHVAFGMNRLPAGQFAWVVTKQLLPAAVRLAVQHAPRGPGHGLGEQDVVPTNTPFRAWQSDASVRMHPCVVQQLPVGTHGSGLQDVFGKNCAEDGQFAAKTIWQSPVSGSQHAPDGAHGTVVPTHELPAVHVPLQLALVVWKHPPPTSQQAPVGTAGQGLGEQDPFAIQSNGSPF